MRLLDQERKDYMEKKVIEAAYGGLLHDIGKPYQRAKPRSDLNEEELYVTPMQKAGYHSHLHAGYTSRFMKENLGMYDAFESMVSLHHTSDQRELARQIIEADWIASTIDRNDEDYDLEERNVKGNFRQVRLSSIFEEVDFGKKKDAAYLELNKLEEMDYPVSQKCFKNPGKDEAVIEYQEFFNRFIDEVDQEDNQGINYLYKKVDRRAFSRMYSLLYQYMSSVPASTYEGGRTFVSLFDHLKLTSAIASCLAISKTPRFRMLEFDVSGIQKFIFKVTEGSRTKKYIAKSLRGRSFLVSLIAESITMAYLNEFGLTESNIIFNTGGGALLLLPDTEDFEDRVKKISRELVKALFERFHTDLTFVYASVSCDKKELETFKTEKAIELKSRLEIAKAHKFLDLMEDSETGENFFFEEAHQNQDCELCGSLVDKSGKQRCSVCEDIIKISDFLTKKENLVLLFAFNKEFTVPENEGVQFRLGSCLITLTSKNWIQTEERKGKLDLNFFDGIESINHDWMGTTRYLALSVPMSMDGNILPMDEIARLASEDQWGDPKLAILKMDVDNLGSIFAYGLDSKTRSLSKFLMLSRMMELFFGKFLPEICKETSEIINEEIDQETSNSTMFYINYAGGDDLVILGPASGILELAEAINRNLNDYTQNQNITISAGIFIQRPAQPIRFGILEAEKLLSRSKENEGKNSVSLIDCTIPFKNFGNILDQVYDWKMAINGEDGEHQKYSRTGFYHLMKLLNVSNFNQYNQRIPLALYSLIRNAKDQQFAIDMKKVISSIHYQETIKSSDVKKIAAENAKSESLYKQLILKMKLTIMQTRD
nr:type III-A CRISPR-associated protein Cas10/Csm1 [Ileibacterium valens]